MNTDTWDCWENEGEDRTALDTLAQQGWRAYNQSEYLLAAELFETLLADAERSEATGSIASAALGWGCSLAEMGSRRHYHHARQLLERAEILSRHLQWNNGEWRTLLGLARLDQKRRLWKQATARILRARRLIAPQGKSLQAEVALAELAENRKRRRLAEGIYVRCAQIAESRGHWDTVGDLWRCAAFTAMARRKYSSAYDYIECMFRISEFEEEEYLAAEAAKLQAIIALRQWRRREAETILLHMREFGQEKKTRDSTRIGLLFCAANPAAFCQRVKDFIREDIDDPETAEATK